KVKTALANDDSQEIKSKTEELEELIRALHEEIKRREKTEVGAEIG
ncbi:hypothetical protein HKBW3S25_01601, partial [Candidatus Hakubella thermalkaliphila]